MTLTAKGRTWARYAYLTALIAAFAVGAFTDWSLA